MHPLVSTEDIEDARKFRVWQEISETRLVSSEAEKIGEDVFEGSIHAAEIGGLLFTRCSFGSLRTEYTTRNVRHSRKQNTVSATIRLDGYGLTSQCDRSVVHRAGEIVVIDRSQAAVLEFPRSTKSLVVEIPRERLEAALGPARNYSATVIGTNQATTSLATTFFLELARVHQRLPRESAAQMASIGVDLLVAAIAERLALDRPKALHGTLVVQRAKAYIASNLGDPTLDPPRVAMAVGVSLRHLQQLFHERGRNISDWIWERRLDVAASRLANGGQAHMPIGMLAHSCGFTTQAHFSRRFKERFGLTPREYRLRALIGGKSPFGNSA